MSYSFFEMSVSDDYSYLLLSVFHKGVENCGSYYKNDETDEEFITSMMTGEKFYNVYDFIYSIKGLGTGYECDDCYFYDEVTKSWVSLYYL